MKLSQKEEIVNNNKKLSTYQLKGRKFYKRLIWKHYDDQLTTPPRKKRIITPCSSKDWTQFVQGSSDNEEEACEEMNNRLRESPELQVHGGHKYNLIEENVLNSRLKKTYVVEGRSNTGLDGIIVRTGILTTRLRRLSRSHDDRRQTTLRRRLPIIGYGCPSRLLVRRRIKRRPAAAWATGAFNVCRHLAGRRRLLLLLHGRNVAHCVVLTASVVVVVDGRRLAVGVGVG
uniref:Uncharacterized protein n=1 Tax=Romanomermis culicivorax TaxID=13658 RepID=A0A915J6D0_ROMCU